MATSIERHEFRYLEPMRVRWAEVDLQKIVFNGHYLMYLDTAVAGYWRDMALPYHEAMTLLDGDLYVRKATLEYEGSARYDDSLKVGVRTQRVGTSSLLLRGAVFHGARALVHGELVYVFADPRTQTSQPVPQVLRDVLARYEAGDAMTSARIGTWDTVSTDVTALRQSLPGHETEGLAANLAVSHDGAGTHIVLVNRLAQAVAAARLWTTGRDGAWQLDALTVHPALRGSGLLDELVRTAHQAARNEGAASITTEVPVGLAPSIARMGFAAASSGGTTVRLSLGA